MKKNDEIKSEIIKKTSELIRQNSEITIKDIANACYVNIAAVNYYFGSKDNLLSIVINQIFDDLKKRIFTTIDNLNKDAPLENILEIMINLIYNFAIENVGLIGYLFLKKENQAQSSNLLVKAFLSNNEFTRVIYQKLSESTGITDKNILYARYVLLFSSFSIPLFIQILQEKDSTSQIATLKDPLFKQIYIKELLRIVQS